MKIAEEYKNKRKRFVFVAQRVVEDADPYNYNCIVSIWRATQNSIKMLIIFIESEALNFHKNQGHVP